MWNTISSQERFLCWEPAEKFQQMSWQLLVRKVGLLVVVTIDGHEWRSRIALMRGQRLVGISYLYCAQARFTVGELLFPIPPRDAHGKRIEADADQQPTLEGNVVDMNTPGWIYAVQGFTATHNGNAWGSGQPNIIPAPPESSARQGAKT